MSSSLFDKTTRGLGASVNLRLLKNNIISSNIANAETPGYKAKKVDFEEALSTALRHDGTDIDVGAKGDLLIDGGAISRVKADVYDNPEGNISNDKNTVDLEKEMAHLAENTILYKAALRLINKKLAALRYVSTEGHR